MNSNAYPGLATWIVLCTAGCAFHEAPSDFMPPGVDPDAPCDPLEGTSRPAFLCEDETRGLIFVREDGGDTAAGTREAPVKSLQQALLLAIAQEASAILIAGSPTFEGELISSVQVDLIGGFDDTFEPDPTQRPMLTHTGSPVVTLKDIEGEVRVSHLGIEQGMDALRMGAGIAVSVQGSELVVFDDVTVISSAGQSGVDGVDGTPGEAGMRGGVAGTGTKIQPGEAGLNPSCPMADGGVGGRGGDPAMMATSGGASATGLMGGAPGMPGSSGSAREPGQAGEDAKPGVFEAGAFVITQDATDGQSGLDGEGGSGGGGGRAQGTQGGGGGGGASGGCAATPGTAGSSGYPSVALLVEESAVRLEGSTLLKTGQGGRAGQGGESAPGGEGAEGGVGTPGAAGGEGGSRGGASSAGAASGSGGHGLPGLAIAVACRQGQVQVEPDVVLEPGASGQDAMGMNAEAVTLSKDCEEL